MDVNLKGLETMRGAQWATKLRQAMIEMGLTWTTIACSQFVVNYGSLAEHLHSTQGFAD